MNSRWQNIIFAAGLVVIGLVCYNNIRELSKMSQISYPPVSVKSHLTDVVRNTLSSSSSSAAASVKSTGTLSKVVGVAGSRRDDGVWYDFSDPPFMLFYAYSAFVDDRPLPAGLRK